MNDTGIGIGLFTPTSRSGWAKKTAELLSSMSYQVDRRNQHRLTVWLPAEARRLSNERYYLDGLEFDSCWISASQTAVRIHPRRLYFDSSDAQSPTRSPERQLLGGLTRPETLSSRLIADAIGLGSTLVTEKIMKDLPVDGDSLATGLVQNTCGIGRSGTLLALEADLWKNLSKAKAFSVPSRMKVILVYDGDEQSATVSTYGEKLGHDWLPKLGVPTTARTVRVAQLKAVLPEIKKVQRGDRAGDFVDAVFLVAIEGQPGQRLPADQEELLSVLDDMQLPYRCFSTDNKQPKWSSRAQAVSVLEGAGGTPYRLALPCSDQLENTLLIGVDIGHATQNRRISHTVVSVLDHFGKHIVSVRRTGRLNEAIDSAALKEMLSKAKEAAFERTGIEARAAVVFRDGLVPLSASKASASAESAEDYGDGLQLPLSLIELRKRGNPFLYSKCKAGFELAASGTACAPVGAEVLFSSAYAAQSGLPRVLKTRIPQGFDDLELGLDAATAIVVGLCYSPSLGLRAHLPGPIYWADGLAATREFSYKFAGQQVIEL
jgi:hypothetical protein